MAWWVCGSCVVDVWLRCDDTVAGVVVMWYRCGGTVAGVVVVR